MTKVLGMGNALVDVLTQLPNDEALHQLNLPKGSMQLIDANFMNRVIDITSNLPKTMAAGGSAANTINGLANLGVSTAFIGKIGPDSIG
ncbi:MAG: adenosine kinase, partial [Bacteroidales bacterium]|nr:adenosine kinase [Bacteroidales bacterium]